MKKLFAILISFLIDLFGRFQHFIPSYEDFSRVLVDKFRHLMISFFLATIGCLLTLIGFISCYFTFLNQIDLTGQLSLNAFILGNLVLFVFGLVTLLWVRWHLGFPATVRSIDSQEKKSSPLEQAISVLILDYVTERETKRNFQSQASDPDVRPTT